MLGPVLPHPELPASKNQLTKLGRRLAAGELIKGDDELYVAVLDAYDQVQTELVQAIKTIHWAGDMPPLNVVGRTKTLDTLVQKLQRSPDIGLPYVRDIAGVRVVGDLSLVQQRAAAAFLADTLNGTVVDRLAAPQSGYRAVHVAAVAGGLPVEIQIRTRLQHLWAEIFERLADRWGRQLRYGGAPDAPGPVEESGDQTPLEDRVLIVRAVQRISDDIYDLEQALDDAHLADLADQPGTLGDFVRDTYGLSNGPNEELREQLELVQPMIGPLQAAHGQWQKQLSDLVNLLSPGTEPPLPAVE